MTTTKNQLLALIAEAKAQRESSSLLAKPLNESSLSRVHQHIITHDTAMLSAFRNNPSDVTECGDLAEPESGDASDTLSVNKRRNRDLKATLLTLGYGVTKMDGSYIEGFDTPQSVEVSEDSLFVVNLKDSPNFFSDIRSLGERFCQDSVLIIPKGGKGASLVGTNSAEFPGFGESVPVGDLSLGAEAEFMSRVRNRPFTFGEGLDTYNQLSRYSRMAAKSIAKRVLNANSTTSSNK
tara:strand:+ start:487 stop:1197 length:711 start_codon:yes stop_codon:yes gene_type:complete